MDKKKQMKFNINNFLLAYTEILDTRDIELNNTSKHHSLRVAFVSLKVAEKLNLQPKEMFDLCAYGLAHHYMDDSMFELLKIADDKNKLSSIIDFVHFLDEKFDISKKDITNRESILNSFTYTKNEKYENIFANLACSIDFWLDCQSKDQMLQFIYSTLYDLTEVLNFQDILAITKKFGSLYNEVDSLLNKCEKMIDYYHFEEKDKYTFLIAASLLNLSKLSIPSKILNKKEKLSYEEYEVIKENVYRGKNALKFIYGFEDIVKWASRHQEHLSGSGYPSGLIAKELSLKDRLMATLNIYNALTSNNSYRKQLSHEKAIAILKEKIENFEIDKAIVEDLETTFIK